MAASKTLALSGNTADPTGLVSGDKGKTWFNTTSNQIKYWDGTSTQTLGAVGASVTSLNGQTGSTQTFATPGTTGTAPAWSSAANAHTLNIPLASTTSVTAGLISNADYNTFNGKVAGVTSGTGVSVSTTGNIATVNLATAGTAGTYAKVTTDAFGRVSAGTTLSSTDIPPISASLVTSGTLNTAQLPTAGNAGTYAKVTTDAYGRVTAGTTLASSDVTAALGFTPINKAGDTITGALHLGSNDVLSAGNIQMAASKTLALSGNTADPTGLVSGDKGKTWFNTTSNQIKYWDGTSTQTLGAVGASVTSLNGQTGSTQTFATPGTTGTAPAWSSAANAHTLNIPLASTTSVTAGLISNADYNTFNGKVAGVTSGTGVSVSTTGNIATVNLATAGTAGTYAKVTTDAFGRVSAGTTLSSTDIPPISASLVTSGTLNTAQLPTAGNAGTYAKVTTDAYGRVTAGTTLASSDITSSLGFTPINKAGDTMTGALTMPLNGLIAGTSQLVLANGNVGIGTTNPTSLLTTAGEVQIGSTSASCNANTAGALQYAGGVMQFCNGSGWGALSTQPAGLIAPFPMAVCPTGWLEANGSAVSRSTYAGLFGAISTIYGSGNGSTTFNLPDYRGLFLRGWDHSAGNDPDAASRTNRGDGTTGDNIGTKQTDAFQGFYTKPLDTSYDTFWVSSPTGSLGNWPGSTGWGGIGGVARTWGAPVSDGTHGTPRTANETRAKNINVTYCISTATTSSTTTVAAAGTGSTNYLPLWTSTSALGNSPLFVSSGRIGVANTTPQSAFDVSGGMSIGSYGGVNAAPANGMIISGNVGIGTTTPVGSLDVGATGTICLGGVCKNTWPTGSVTGVTGTAPVTVSGSGALTVSMAAATTSVDGYLKATDWTTFNNKQAALTNATSVSSGILTSSDWTMFNNKVSSLNGLVGGAQTFATPGTTGTAPAWASSGTTHTLNIPMASATSVTAGLLSNADWVTFNNAATGTWSKSGTTLNYSAGNVGIGSSSPGAKLDIVGDLRLDGATSGYLGLKAPATVTTPVTLTLPNGDGASGQALTTNGSGTLSWGTVTGGKLIGVYSSSTAASNYSMVFTGAANTTPSLSGTTLTLPSNTSYIVVEIWGGGAAGAAGGSSTGYYAGAGGGGAGGYSKKFINSPSGTYYYTIGSGGAASGNAGNTTCFGTNATACTSPIMSANGGSGGSQTTDSANGGLGGGGGSATGGDLNLKSGAGGSGGIGQSSAPQINGGGGAGGFAANGGAGGAAPGGCGAGAAGNAPGGGGSGGAGGCAAVGGISGGAGGSGGMTISVYAAGVTNTVASSGSGTANYVPAWTSSTALGNSPLAVSGSNVGIGSAAPTAALDVAGSIKSSMWKVTGVLANSPGGLPLSGSFSSGGGSLMVTACGAGYYGAAGVVIGFNVQIDSVTKGGTSLYLNEANSHRALPCANFVVTGIAAGSHTASIVANTITTNGSDFFSLTIIEFPF